MTQIAKDWEDDERLQRKEKMSGTRDGGLKAVATNRRKYGDDFYVKMGKKGGSAYHRTHGGFASEKIGKDGLTGFERARLAGRKGGLKSRRGKTQKTQRRVHWQW